MESVLASDQLNDKRNTTSSHRGDDNDANTGGTVGATTGTTSRRRHVRGENGDDNTYLDRGFDHDTTHDTTRSDRRGGGREGERVGGLRAGARACARAVLQMHGAHSARNNRLCVDSGAASFLDDPPGRSLCDLQTVFFGRRGPRRRRGSSPISPVAQIPEKCARTQRATPVSSMN